MKQLNPNLIDALRARHISQLYLIRTFKRYWGTEIMDGVEIFTPRNYYYKQDRMTEGTRKLAKRLGMLDDLLQKQEGIDSAWLYLNKDNDKATTMDWGTSLLARNFDKAIGEKPDEPVVEEGEEPPPEIPVLTGTIQVMPYKRTQKNSESGQESTRYVNPGLDADKSDQEALKAEVVANFTSYLARGFPVYTEENDPYKALILSYVLRSSEVEYTIESVKEKVVGTPGSKALVGYGIEVDLSVNWFDFRDSTDIILALLDDITTRSELNSLNKPHLVAQAEVPIKHFRDTINRAGRWTVDDYELDPDDTSEVELKYEPATYTTSDYWLREGGSSSSSWSTKAPKYHLKTSILDAPELSKQAKIEFLYSMIDSDYKKKKVSGWKKVVSIVLVVVAVVLAVWTGGASLALMKAGLWAMVAAGAVVITTAALYISLMSAAFSALGAEQIGSALAKFNQQMAPLTKVAGVIAFTNIIVSGIRQALAKEVAKEAAKEAAGEAVKRTIVDITIDIVKVSLSTVVKLATGASNLAEMGFSHVTKMVGMVLTEYDKRESKQHEKRMRGYQKELDSLRESEEQNQVSDLIKDMIITGPNLLAKDNSVYSELYDRPYEWWSTKYHTGCMQANSVSGAWRMDDRNDIIQFNENTGV